MNKITSPELDRALSALEETEAEAARAGDRKVHKGGHPTAQPANRNSQALTLGQPNKKWVRLICRTQVATSKGGNFGGQET